jgi:restriction system protein
MALSEARLFVAIPTITDLIVPTVVAMRDLGGSGRNAEIRNVVADALGLSEEDQQTAQGGNNPSVSRLEYRLKWARTYLRNSGVIRSIGTGLWELTEDGLSASDADVLKWAKQWGRARPESRPDQIQPQDDATEEEDVEPDDGDEAWDETVIAAVQEMEPAQVERLFLRVLREEGFEQLEHVGKPGDGGIDGVGVYRISLLSFRIYFQCKRYRSGIGAGDIRDFRGAMEGRGERGLFVTTSWFTKSAEEEASRPGARAVDLIDGSQLAALIARHGLGVSIETLDKHVVNRAFFQEFKS